jgi:hypothetical protein
MSQTETVYETLVMYFIPARLTAREDVIECADILYRGPRGCSLYRLCSIPVTVFFSNFLPRASLKRLQHKCSLNTAKTLRLVLHFSAANLSVSLHDGVAFLQRLLLTQPELLNQATVSVSFVSRQACVRAVASYWSLHVFITSHSKNIKSKPFFILL